MPRDRYAESHASGERDAPVQHVLPGMVARRLPSSWLSRLEGFDRRLARFLRRYGDRALRYALAIIFIWFGVLKPLGISPAEPLVKQSVAWMPFFSPDTYNTIIGCSGVGKSRSACVSCGIARYGWPSR